MEQPLSWMPVLNAGLNGLSLVLLIMGRRLIKAGRERAHRRAMLAACASSLVFLCFYLYYHAHAGHTPFLHQGWVRGAYFSLLISHVLLAATVPVFAVMLVRYGLLGMKEKHRRLARVAWPIWVYVSVTGLLVYFMLYRWFPGAPA